MRPHSHPPVPLERRRHRAGVLVLLSAAALIAGCGSSHSKGASTPASTTTPTTAPKTVGTKPSTTTTAQAPKKGHRGSSSHSGSSSDGHGHRRSPTVTVPLRTPHLDTAAAGGCPEGTTMCVTKSTTVKPTGSPYIDRNLEAAIAHNQRLVDAKVTCPAARSYPVNCTVTGKGPLHGHMVAIKGTISVLGVEVRTRTYAYSLDYGPVKS